MAPCGNLATFRDARSPRTEFPLQSFRSACHTASAALESIVTTRLGCQYFSRSRDRGESWTAPQPSNIESPQSPALLRRIPATRNLHFCMERPLPRRSLVARHRPARAGLQGLLGKRTPFTIAVSHDEARTWQFVKNIQGNSTGMYAYPAVCLWIVASSSPTRPAARAKATSPSSPSTSSDTGHIPDRG